MKNELNTNKRDKLAKYSPGEKITKQINPGKIIWPFLFGCAFTAGMLYWQLKDTSFSFNILQFTKTTILFLFIAWACMFLRDMGYIVRLRVLADNRLTWRQAFRIILLWEFTSAITPSSVGGTAFAVVFIHKEGMSIGNSASIVLLTSFLDELYFVLMFPLLVLLIGPQTLFSVGDLGQGISFTNEFFYFGMLGYIILLLYVLFVGYGLFINPVIIKKIILKIFQFRFLRRWRKSARKAGRDIELGSMDYKNKSFTFWMKAFGSTFITWTARYWVVNFIFIAFFVINKSHFLLFARQLVMWIMMLVSPTPGGSGLSELVFSEYLGDFLPQAAGISVVLAVFWRFYTYYPYLFIGAMIVPGWLKKNFSGSKKGVDVKTLNIKEGFII
jgi:uncharacterized protein (TIRG00374 family)